MDLDAFDRLAERDGVDALAHLRRNALEVSWSASFHRDALLAGLEAYAAL